MNPSGSKTLKCLSSLICLVFSIALAAQTPELTAPVPTPESVRNPDQKVAYVYISQEPDNSGPNQILGFAAAANGKLTSIKGSPFDANVGAMAVNGKYLFAGASNYPDNSSINTYAIEPDGDLRFVVSNSNPQVGSTNYDQLFLDHTGATLYALLDYVDEDEFASFSIDKATGTLAFTQSNYPDRYEQSFTVSSNDKYIYVASAWEDGPEVDTLNTENWTLTTDPVPVPRPTGYSDPYFLSTGPLNHVAGAFAPGCGICDGGWYSGSIQLGVYTADADGNLTTTSTYKNMATTMFGPSVGASDMRMSPSGKLLAISGGSGLQVFHFNGSEPITPYATLVKNSKFNPQLDAVPFKQLYWDNDNHLFALFANKLYVFTVTPTSITEAPGSPHTIAGFPGAQYLTVQPLPLQ